MDALPVQYVTTSDGYSIAYSVSGQGRQLVLLPSPFSTARNRMRSLASGLLRSLSRPHRVVTFDARGMGMSQRGLLDGHNWEAYVRDLEAVLARLEADPLVLWSSLSHWRTAVRFAAQHPERVDALILHNPDARIEAGERQHPFYALARDSWDSFLLMLFNTYGLVRGGSGLAEASSIEEAKTLVTREDYLKFLEAITKDDARPFLSAFAAPTLIICERQPGVSEENSLLDVAQRLAAAIPNSRLSIFDSLGEAFYAERSGDNPGVRLIDEFLNEVTPSHSPAGYSLPVLSESGLSSRELEVLRLVAAGKSNQQIADELVISLFTVNRHVSNIFAKTGAVNRAEAASYAHRHGLV
jgi:pimeloyl-ACP methyl ester carboxylesterase/DNA-binding CsgD family transcriptional regulator